MLEFRLRCVDVIGENWTAWKICHKDENGDNRRNWRVVYDVPVLQWPGLQYFKRTGILYGCYRNVIRIQCKGRCHLTMRGRSYWYEPSRDLYHDGVALWPAQTVSHSLFLQDSERRTDRARSSLVFYNWSKGNSTVTSALWTMVQSQVTCLFLICRPYLLYKQAISGFVLCA